MAVDTAPTVIGRDEHGKDVLVDVIFDNHILCTGATRSGKSVFSYLLVGGLIASKAPVRVVGIDPTGILLRPFSDDEMVTLSTTPDDLLRVLDRILAEFHQRLEQLSNSGLDKFSYVDTKMPTIFVVIEEYQALLNELDIADRSAKPADRVRPKVEAAVDTLLAGGLKCQIKLLVLMQRASHKRIDTDSRANFSTRISFRVDDDESLGMVFPGIDQTLLRRLQTASAGIGLIKRPGKEVVLFRGDLVSYTDYLKVASKNGSKL